MSKQYELTKQIHKTLALVTKKYDKEIKIETEFYF